MSTTPQQSNSALNSDAIEPDKLHRSMGVWNSFTLGFAVVSPVVGLYAIIGVQTTVTGGGWFAALVICLVMQLLVATVYAELSSQFPIAGGAYKWSRQLGGVVAGQYAGVIYVSSTIAMLTTTAYTGGIWLATFWGSSDGGGPMMVFWGAVFLLLCMLLNLAPVNIFKSIVALGVYAEIVGSFGIALLLFFFFRQYGFSELFQHLGTGTAPTETAAFMTALAIAGWAFIGFDACSTTAEETHQPKRMVPRAIFFSLMGVGTIVLFNSAALILTFDHDTLINTSKTADPVTPLITSSLGAWIEKPFSGVVMVAFLACGASVVKYTSRIVYSMAREGNMPAVLSNVTADKTPRNAILFTVMLAALGLLLGLNDGAVATIIAFGTGGLYAMFAMTTGVGLFARLAGRWNPALGELKLGVWGVIINFVAFLWSLFELINIAWPRSYAVATDAPWWQLWAIPLVLGSILSMTTVFILVNKFRDNSKIPV
ncbi:amino acid/polyamine/organocation transporter, APC superfamily [Nitrosomonas cryotolerans]|uniref:Amino acid/polyamine/organocation transporter, APC superfamily n=1 Tax=Nitrosomonas cryotolerans ATCC 49181 TaxID=1131553 RepID=A0A1N6G283_9PROT|nr:APC family permease [Nitrosomonas cryotolerans]SFQ07952.1 amino acid/polyamine/organocation transporter, APC superfamily [Nitrosomonas cryotolerans]SIO01628.1 amino acid/polyamine/organocation transporter, APC superfamily [Nitrosomonas cryotolerans ATCC 49181]